MPRRIRAVQYIAPPPLTEAGAKYRHLRPEQREARRRTALHEAAHLVVGIVLGADCFDAFVRVPGRTPRSALSLRGVVGRVNVDGQTTEHSAMIDLAAVLTEIALREDWERHAVNDLASAGERIDRLGLSEEQIIALCDRTMRTVVDYWSAIDGVAAALLELGDRGGVVRVNRIGAVVDWVQSGLWRDREPLYPVPWAFEERLRSINAADQSALH